MTYYQVSALINCIASYLIGAIVYFKNPKNLQNRTFSLFCLSVGSWSFGYLFWQLSINEGSALLWCRILMAWATFISPFFFHFVTTLLELNTKRLYRLFIKAGYILAFLFLLASFTPLFVKEISPNRFFKFWPQPGGIYPLYLLLFFGYAIYAWYLMLKKYKIFKGGKRNQIKYILLGTIIGYIGGSTNYPLWYGIPIPPVGNLLVTAYVVLIGYAIIKYKLLDVHFIIRRAITTIVLIILASSMIWITYYPRINLPMKLTLGFIIACLGTIYLPRLKLKIENRVSHILYKGKYDYLDKIETFLEKMALIPREEDLIKDTTMILTRDLYAEDVTILIRDYITGEYTIRYKTNLGLSMEFKLSQENRITSWLKKHRIAFVLEEEEKRLHTLELENIKKELEPLDAKVCIPARLDSDLIGIIALGNKTTGEMYTHIDLDLLERLGVQLAVALDYKRVESQLRKEQELASIGIMSMEIGHELRNLLQLPQTYIDLSFEKRNDDDFYRDFRNMAMDRMKVIRDKLNDIMYLGKERPLDLATDVEINSLLDENLIANEFSIKKENIEIVKEYAKLPLIMADKSQLTHLFNNLILNAIDAMKNRGGKFRIRTIINTNNITGEMKDRSSEWIRVEVKDDGTGIPDYVLKRLFTPFVTTKSLGHIEKSGTGLGLSVVKKVVDAHKGYIHVHTEEGKGTTFVVDLPIELKASFVTVPSKSAGEPWEYKE